MKCPEGPFGETDALNGIETALHVCEQPRAIFRSRGCHPPPPPAAIGEQLLGDVQHEPRGRARPPGPVSQCPLDPTWPYLEIPGHPAELVTLPPRSRCAA